MLLVQLLCAFTYAQEDSVYEDRMPPIDGHSFEDIFDQADIRDKRNVKEYYGVQTAKNGDKTYVTMIMAYEFKTRLVYYHFNVMTPATEDPPREMMCEHFKYEMDLNRLGDDFFEMESG